MSRKINLSVLLVVFMTVQLLHTVGIAYGKNNGAAATSSSKQLRCLSRMYMTYGFYDKAQPFAEKRWLRQKKRMPAIASWRCVILTWRFCTAIRIC